jgi:hypothetical protein
MIKPEDLIVERLRDRARPAEQVDRVLEGGWPAFIGADAKAERHLSRVRDAFGDHELALVARTVSGDGDGEELVALGWAVPLRWSGAVADLPGGYTESLGQALADLDACVATDTLVVCAVQVRSDLGGRGLAGRLLAGFVEHAVRTGHERGHRPAAPDSQAHPPAHPDRRVRDLDRQQRRAVRPMDPRAPAHGRVGARHRAQSQTMTATVAQWEDWTGMRLPATGSYVIPGGLSPLEIDVDADLGTYVETERLSPAPLTGLDADTDATSSSSPEACVVENAPNGRPNRSDVLTKGRTVAMQRTSTGGGRRRTWRTSPGTVTFSFGVSGADIAGEAELVTFVDADQEAAELASEAAFVGDASRRPRAPGAVSL